MDSKRDDNRVASALGVSSVDGTTTLPVQIDSVTGRVLFNCVGVTDAGSVVAADYAVRDDNRVTVCLGEKSDGSGLAPVAVDSRNGRIWLDLA